jgi:hypothetical protein
MQIKQAEMYKSNGQNCNVIQFLKKKKSGIGVLRFYAYSLGYRFPETVQIAYQVCATCLFDPLLSLTELKKIAITTSRFTFFINDETGVT